MLGLSLNTLGALAISQLAFTGVFFFVYHRQQVIGRLLALYSISFSAYVLAQMVGPDSPVLYYLLNRISTIAPAALWLLALYLFVDNPRVSRPIWALMGSYVLMRALGAYFGTGDTLFLQGLYVVGYVIPQFVMLAFCTHAIYLAMQDLRNDLVESRHRVRVPFVIAMGLLVTMVLMRGFATALEYYSLPAMIPQVPLPYLFFYIALIAFAFNICSTRLRNEAIQVIVLQGEQQKRHLSAVPSTTINVDNPALVNKIFEALDKDKLYTRPGLTIGELAERLSVQEYRLRRVINKQLGYRNFNQFLNEFRIKEACRRLISTEDHREQIANIAYDVGYSALSSFNKAFKDIHNLTPTQYRDAALQEVAGYGLRGQLQ
ncbi:MAG: AraC family transcriptional regulator [Pseudomonadales bacterium]|nr:AraC family transcriptional regulator [Pseudomonadales bacterium]MCP5331081.1 AraC family transcriptional regulator [Pseudomonadales bacterium]MCP5343544.1 AraC family transcriptional regulator [Pseudomonadales bacterium]